MFTPICVAETERKVRRHFETLRDTNPQYVRMMNAETAWISGTPANVRRQIKELEAIGVARLLLSVNCDLHVPMLPLLRDAIS